MPNPENSRMASVESIESNFSGFRSQVNLMPYNTLGIPAVASRFKEIKVKKELQNLFGQGFFSKHQPLVLGGGSNILFRNDPSYPVLKMSIEGIEITGEDKNKVLVKAGAGVVWHKFVEFAVHHNFGGIENLALIPGTVGAAPIQNIGAYGVELEEVFESLEFFDPVRGDFRIFNHNDCRFGYRDSIFKNELKEKAIVTSVILKLNKHNHQINTGYYALQQWLDEKGITEPGIRDVFNAVVSIRNSKLPDPALIGNAGSFFKNPVIDRVQFEKLKDEHPEVPSFPAGDGMIKVPAGWLIEQCGWKGKQVGNVGTYRNQALVIVNHGGATGNEVFTHARNIQQSVASRFGIHLTPEVNIVD